MAGETFPIHRGPEISRPCRECLSGRCKLIRNTLLSWEGADMLAVQNFPIWICDLCGWRDYDERAIFLLKTLLHPPAVRAGRQTSGLVYKADDPAMDWMRVEN